MKSRLSRWAKGFALTPRRSSGFTLIELIVVIAIIAILATLILTALNSVRGRSRDVRAASNLVQGYATCQVRYDLDGTYENCVVADTGAAEEAGVIDRLHKDTQKIDGAASGDADDGITIDRGSGNLSACLIVTLNAKSSGKNKKFCRDSSGVVSPTGGSTGASCAAGVCTPGT